MKNCNRLSYVVQLGENAKTAQRWMGRKPAPAVMKLVADLLRLCAKYSWGQK